MRLSLLFLALFFYVSPLIGEEVKVYTVKAVNYYDDDGYNDEIGVTLGDKELFLLIRWYTGVRFHVGDEVTVHFYPENKSIMIDDNTYDYLGKDFYFLW